MKRFATYCLLFAAVFWASTLKAQPPFMRGDRGDGDGPGGGPRGGFRRPEAGPGGLTPPWGGGRGGPGSSMRGRGDRGGGPGGFMRGGRDRGGDRRGGRDRGGRGFGPPMGGPGESDRDRFARFEGMLRGFDANRDGVIDPNEVPENRRRFLGFIGARMGVDFSKPVALDKLREKAAERFGGDENNKEPEPLVPGFGVPQAESTVLAFGERPAPPNSSSAGRSSDREQDPRAERIADALMGRFDRNRNGVLERDAGEWAGMPGDAGRNDRNNDGRIDREELVAGVSAFMGGMRGDDRGRDREEDRQQRRSESGEEDRQSYRFLSPVERLPEGLPDWFADRDENRDAQVTMAEYSSYWSDSKAREYLRYDLNDDGVITPEECLTAVNQPDFVAPASGPAGPPREGDSPQGEPEPEQEKRQEKKESGGDKPWWMQN